MKKYVKVGTVRVKCKLIAHSYEEDNHFEVPLWMNISNGTFWFRVSNEALFRFFQKICGKVMTHIHYPAQYGYPERWKFSSREDMREEALELLKKLNFIDESKLFQVQLEKLVGEGKCIK